MTATPNQRDQDNGGDLNDNIVLIGMPGAGKSTVGVLLAKILARPFVDTDLLIQTREGAPLQALIDRYGPAAFCDIEARAICDLTVCNTVIATGGSAVYRQRSMRHLRMHGFVVYLQATLPTLTGRLTDLDRRGVVLPRQQSLASLYTERSPLYQRYAHACIDCDGHNHNQVAAAVLAILPASLQGLSGKANPAADSADASLRPC